MARVKGLGVPARTSARRRPNTRWTRAPRRRAALPADRHRQRDLPERQGGRQPRLAGRRLRTPQAHARRHGLDRPLPAEGVGARQARGGVRPARAGRRGRDRRLTSGPRPTATATRCSSCCAPPATSTTVEEVGVRRAARLRRPQLRDHRTARRGPRPPGGPQAHGVRPRPAPPGPAGGAVRHPGRRRRRLRPGRRRAAERHRRDRGPGLRRRPVGLPPHLRAVPRGHRVPAGHPAAGAA